MAKKVHIELHNFDDLTLYKWDRFLSTNDANWFRTDFDGRQTKINTDELNKRKDVILDDYIKALNDQSFTNKLKTWAKIDVLRTKYNTVSVLLERMWLGFATGQMDLRGAFINHLNKWGFKFNMISTLDEDKELIIKYRNALEGIKTQITILEQEVQQESRTETDNLHKQLVIVSMGLQLGYQLNSRTLLLIEWIEMCKLLQEKSKQN